MLEEKVCFWILGERANKASFFFCYVCKTNCLNKSKSKGLEALGEALVIVGAECPSCQSYYCFVEFVLREKPVLSVL